MIAGSFVDVGHARLDSAFVILPLALVVLLASVLSSVLAPFRQAGLELIRILLLPFAIVLRIAHGIRLEEARLW
jgi:hypothetical protein